MRRTLFIMTAMIFIRKEDFMIMGLNFLITYIAIGICELSLISLKRRNAKKCNYDCEKCKNWDCMAYEFNKKRHQTADNKLSDNENSL